MFKKILIANRGEIAVRIARTCKRMGISSVAVFSDADAGALHVSVCDESVRIGPALAKDSYLNMAAIIEAAKQTGAEAVHPGYGFLSERAEFAEAVAAAGLTFIGPKPEHIRLLGDKLNARQVADRAKVRTLPGGSIDLHDLRAARRLADQIGYPLLIKASGGGGGIGMRRVQDEDALETEIANASQQALRAFGSGVVYLEKLLDKPRHVEIQVISDGRGDISPLGDRECSVQRRHQKLIEESPAPGLSQLPHGDAIRGDMMDAAVRMFDAAGYANAGTCEFLLDASGVFYFLEVNSRLQVEHTVTEMCTGLDLVELQILVAHGEPLPSKATSASQQGHAIEARVCAENAEKGFLPAPGRIESLRWPYVSAAKGRIESGVVEGSEVTPYYDSLIAKLVAYGPTRHRALLQLDRMLAETHIAPLTTNIPFLRQVLADIAFAAGQYDTSIVGRLLSV